MYANFTIKHRIKLRVVNILLRLIQLVRIYGFRWLSTAFYEGRPVMHQPVQLVGMGKIRFDTNVNIGVFPSPFYLTGYAYIEAREKNASVEIGKNTWINNNFVVIAEHSKIKIGNNVLIGTNVEIYDSDFHGLQRDERKLSHSFWAKPVNIENDVFLGSNVKILKGVTIGQGSIVANGSIVVSDIPENVIAGGVPARVLRHI